ncbi:MAG: shikimate kinase [Actinomycetota bacterium]
MNVYLVGMPGSGKSSVGRVLAPLLKLGFVDLDEEVEQQTGRTVVELFESGGEGAFRLAESRALASVAAGRELVVACGGGIVLDPSNRALLSSSGVVVYLEAPLETLRARVGEGAGRPLLGGDDAAHARLELLLADREPLYRSTAGHVVDAARDAETVAKDVAEALRS